VIDLGPVPAKRGVVTVLRHPAAFNTVEVGARGRTLVWQDSEGDEIDLCADARWQMSHQSTIDVA